MKTILTSAALMALAGAVHAQEMTGDAEAGERAFNQCKACHMVQTDDGEMIVRAGRTGPNLWGVVGREAGAVEDYRYSSAMEDAGEAGLVWTEEEFTAYVMDPTGYLREYLDDSSARGKMSYRLRDADDAADIWAWLASVSPEPETDEETEESMSN
ncbi:c-type cytochrome [Lacimonas salitolerans]|uniref:C-type cytochrome n=1 Tax=Lacimonas salitolerans TaxID=1323750 RepID=A0ABW4EGC1_9RHOB